MKTAAILLRVSTEQQDMESQKNEVLNVAKKEGFEVPDKYVFGQKITGRDNARKEDRQSIKDLKAACSEGEIKAVFICEVSRLSRDPIAGRLYIQDFKDQQIPIYFCDLKMWTLAPDTLEETPYSSVIDHFFDIAKSELATLKKRSLRGRKQNAREGLVTGGYIKYGYKKEPTTKKIIIDETEAAFIQDIYNKYASGKYSIRSLTLYANSTDNPSRYKKNSKKGTYTTNGGITKSTSSIVWTTQVIRSMLCDKIYFGNRTFKEISSPVPAIITEELFNIVQKRLKANPTSIEKSKHIHLLQKIMICGNCGSVYYGSYKKRSNAYLCSNYTRTAVNCRNTTLNYERAESIIWDYIKSQTYFFKKINEEKKQELIDEQKEKQKELLKNRLNYVKLIEKQETQRKNLIQTVIAGVFKMEELSEETEKIRKELKSCNTEINKIDDELRLIANRIRAINSKSLTTEAIKNIEADRKLMKEKIKETIDKIVVYKLEGKIALMQVYCLDEIYNLMYYYRKKEDRYYYVIDDVATFNCPKQITELGLSKKALNKLIPPLSEFTITSNNNNTFKDDIFGEYSGVNLIEILEKNGFYRDYKKFDKIIPKNQDIKSSNTISPS